MEHLIAKLIDDYDHGQLSRRQLIRSLGVLGSIAGAGPVASADKAGFRAVAVNHISYNVADYRRTRDFYADLLGMKVSHDDGKQCILTFGDAALLPRNARRGRRTPFIDHVAYSIENWDAQQVERELIQRGLKPRPDTANSFHVQDPDGFDVQICSKDMQV